MSLSNTIAAIAVLISLVSVAAAWKSEATAQRAVELQQTMATAQMITTLSSLTTANAEGTLKRLCGVLSGKDIDPVSYAIFQKSCSEKFSQK
jgi:hypothetical protein